MVEPREQERTLGRIHETCLALPETSERLSHGAPTFFVRGKCRKRYRTGTPNEIRSRR